MGEMRLRTVVAEIVGDVIAGRVINKRRVAVDRWDDIDADGQYLAGIDGVVLHIDRRARALQVRAAKSVTGDQAELPFRLPAAVAMDREGATLVATRQLSRPEFARAIEIRQMQIVNDGQALREWRNALRQADRFWDDHPDWSFGQCLDAILTAGGVPAPALEVQS